MDENLYPMIFKRKSFAIDLWKCFVHTYYQIFDCNIDIYK